MSDKHSKTIYIEIPRQTRRVEKISSVLEKRMKALVRKRYRQLRREGQT